MLIPGSGDQCVLGLQAKLHDVLMEKKREAKANQDAIVKLTDSGSSSRTGPSRRDDDLFKVRCPHSMQKKDCQRE